MGDFSGTPLLVWAQKALFKGVPWKNVTLVTTLSQILLFPKAPRQHTFKHLSCCKFQFQNMGLSHLANADYSSHLQRKVLYIEWETSYFHTEYWVMVITFHVGNIFMSNSGCEKLCAPCQLLGFASVGMGSWCITNFLQTYLNWKKGNLTKKKKIPLLVINKVLNFQIMRNYYISSSVNFVWRLKADVSTFFKEHEK